MESTRTKTDKFLLFVKGVAMGAANKVPGVSGGIVAFVVGFYEEFIFSLKRVNRNSFRLLINGRFHSFFRYINGRFLSLLILGMIFSYFTVSRVLDYLIQYYEVYVWSCFFGLILGSIYFVSKDFKLRSYGNLMFIAIGAVIGVTISLMKPAAPNDDLWFIFICGFISVSGMTLPGLSGSFILMLIGNYVLLMVDSVNALFFTLSDIVSWDFSFINNEQRMNLLKILGSFTLGSLVGMIGFSHILGYVLKHFKNITYALIIGFITGSLGVVWPWKREIFKRGPAGKLRLDSNGNPILSNYDRFLPNITDWNTWFAIFFIILGILIVFGLEQYGNKNSSSHG